MTPYTQRRNELTVVDNCVLWGSRVVVPLQARSQVVEELHEGHPGSSRMKSLARGYVWWPGMDGELEKKVKECPACQSDRKMPPQTPLHSWEWPERPWSRLHIGYAGPVMGRMLLIVVDSHSKWIEVHVTTSATVTTITEKLQTTFATHGLPEVLVSDNGSAFVSTEFEEFCSTMELNT